MKYLDDTGLSTLISSIKKFLNGDYKKEILLASHPIGSLYWSEDSTSPATLFGGTWIQIKDTFILTAGDNYEAGTTGGSATQTLIIENLPAHTHGLNSHIHTYSKSNTTTEGLGLTIKHMPAHTHNIYSQKCSKEATGYGLTKSSAFTDRPMVYR
jgi:hypothetical protein